MSVFQRLKKQAAVDFVVILAIVLAGVGFIWYSGQNLPGWDIKGTEELMENEERELASNVYVRNRGALTLRDSELIIDGEYDRQYGLYLGGDARLTLDGSTVSGDEYRFTFSSTAEDGTSPEISITDSEISRHVGMFLYNRTHLTAQDSQLGAVHVRDDVRVNVSRSDFLPVLYPREREVLSGLIPGESVTREIGSESGWELSMTECSVDAYTFSLFRDYELEIADSSGVRFSFYSPGDLGVEREIEIPYAGSGVASSGQMMEEELGFDLKWNNTVVDSVSMTTTGTDSVRVSGGTVGAVQAIDDSRLEVAGSALLCTECIVSGTAQLVLDGITVPVTEGGADETRYLFIHDFSEAQIKNSDIRDLHVVLFGSSKLVITGSQVNEDQIENLGNGTVSIDGEERATLNEGSNVKSVPAVKSILMVVAPSGYREEELEVPLKAFENAGYQVKIASRGVESATGSADGRVRVDVELADALAEDYTAVVFVGGGGAEVLFNDADALRLARDAVEKGKVIAAICIAPSILANADVLEGKRATSFSSERENLISHGAQFVSEDVVSDGRIVTAHGPSAAQVFSEEVLKLLNG
ncbi:MAG: DJ-1/PfpI family protein [Candidatus Dojkabacteria bacterium]|nr:DJ-1/PfpI family protein [Candidatus Dojkabacteria bacterium]